MKNLTNELFNGWSVDDLKPTTYSTINDISCPYKVARIFEDSGFKNMTFPNSEYVKINVIPEHEIKVMARNISFIFCIITEPIEGSIKFAILPSFKYTEIVSTFEQENSELLIQNEEEYHYRLHKECQEKYSNLLSVYHNAVEKLLVGNDNFFYEENMIYFDPKRFELKNHKIPKEQSKIIRDALDQYLKNIINIKENLEKKYQNTDELGYLEYDIYTLKSMMNYELSINISQNKIDNFSMNHNVDFPEYK